MFFGDKLMPKHTDPAAEYVLKCIILLITSLGM